MRIDSIDLIRFGHFANREIALPPRKPDFYVIYGDNEAGKSTLLRGISALLFGVPTRTPDVHSCKGSELRVGATISDDGRSFSFRRRKGISGTLLNVNEGQILEDALSPFLLELDRDRFEQLFGLDHKRLREGGEELLHGKGDIGSALFQATGLLDLRSLLDGLDGEARELFSPKSRTKAISRAIDEYKQTKSEVRRLAISAAVVKQKQAKLEAAEEAVEKLKAESQSLQEQLVRLRRIASNKPDVARLQELRTVLLALESVPRMPANARSQRDEAAASLSEATSQSKTLTEHIGERKTRIEALPVGNLFTAHAKEIEDLNAGTSDYIRSVTDRPKRMSERDEEIQLASVDWSGIWHHRPVSDAEQLKAVYSRKAEILSLITEHARLSTALAQTQEELVAGQEEQERLGEELALHPDLPDPATLRATIEEAKSLGDIDHVIARLRSNVQRLAEVTAGDLKGLRPWSGSSQELENLKTPLLTSIDQYAREWETITGAQRDLTARLSEVEGEIREKQIELDRQATEVGDAGESELGEIRSERDQLWRLIRASAFDKTLTSEDAQRQSSSAAPLADAFTARLQDADRIADLRFTNAKDVATHDRVMKEIDLARREKQQAKGEIEKRQGEHQELRQRWEREWGGLGSALLSPTEMKEWMQSRRAILERIQQSREKESELRVLQERASMAATQLRARLAEVESRPIGQNESLAVLLKGAEGFANKLEEEGHVIKDIRRRLELLSLPKRQAKLDQCKARLSDWSQRWSPLVSGLLLPESSTPEQVGEALAVLEKVFAHLKDAERLQYRLKRIGDNIELFETQVSQVVAAIDPSLASLSAGAAATELHLRLVKTGKAETQREELETENGKDAAAISTCRSKAQVAEDVLKQLNELAGCDDDQQLETIIAASEKRTEKREEYERIAIGLIERNAVSDVKQVEEEASGYELDSLQSEIVSSADRLKVLQDEVFKTGSEHGRLLQEFEQLQNSDESTLQAQKAEDALARVRPAIAQYLRLRLASEVLRRAIESYREKHQGPVLSRASELFSSITLGDHCGLTTGFGDDDKPVLVAIRKNKEQVVVEGLSDGTRDQLYLALRLAAIEHHVQTVASCPVILDDILINSDDARASAALQVIGDMGKRTQVLFFTHHRRLTELGIKAGAQVIDLGSSASTALG